jgi:hypothetical protein
MKVKEKLGAYMARVIKTSHMTTRILIVLYGIDKSYREGKKTIYYLYTFKIFMYWILKDLKGYWWINMFVFTWILI